MKEGVGEGQRREGRGGRGAWKFKGIENWGRISL